jgi:hypothetical protein
MTRNPMGKPLDSVGVSIYISEVRDLLDSLLFGLQNIGNARSKWLQSTAAATAQAKRRPSAFSHDLFAEALNKSALQQRLVFDTFEALLAAWARLSLLLHPVAPKTTPRSERGRLLREALQLPDNTLLADRSFRDSWMHFDERLDQAYEEGWLGNRQQFVNTTGVPSAVQVSVRVIDIEGLAFHFRTKAGNPASVRLDDMRACLALVENGLNGIGSRMMQIFPRPTRP